MLSFEKPIFELKRQIDELLSDPQSDRTWGSIRKLQIELRELTEEIFSNLTAWEVVQVARHENRPRAEDYIKLVFDEFLELHGDRTFGDDGAILTGFAKIDGQKLMLIAQEKGRTAQERRTHNCGLARPEGFRKARRAMQLAAKFDLPIVSLIDTLGADPSIGSESRGQAQQIAFNLREMSQVPTPVVSIIIGEGGSDGALAIGMADHLAILEYAYFSVLAPEGCANILWKHARFADRAAEVLKLTASDLFALKVVDEIIPEPSGGAHRDHRIAATNLKHSIQGALKELMTQDRLGLLERRYRKFRNIGQFAEPSPD